MRQLGIAVASALVASGCNAILGIDDLTLKQDAVVADAAVDAPAICYGTLVPGCFPAVPTGTLTLGGMLDTANDVRCSMGPNCVIGADSITVDTLAVTGPRPLVLVAVTTLTVANQLDAVGTPTRPGPGANSPMCSTPSPGAVLATSGGGAGGSFGGSGVSGGSGAMNGGAGGTPGAIQTPTVLRGGCPGGAGAGAAGIGAGGPGGGAVALYAGVKIQINQDVRASGLGGRGAQSANAGGGGGGSGGMIVLEATTINVANDVFANGGGGGEGATAAGGGNGSESSAFDSNGSGGSGNPGGDGGRGFALNSPADAGKTAGMGGGGGGGGGAGVIWVKGTVTGTKISPTAIPR